MGRSIPDFSFPRTPTGLGGPNPCAVEQFYPFWLGVWAELAGRHGLSQGTFQKITKLQARVKIWRGLLGNNSNLVIKRSAGAVFPPLLSACVIMPRGGTILKWWCIGLLGLAGLWLARQCVLAYAGLFSNERKKSVAESVRKTKGLSGAFWGRGLFFKKRLKL